MITVVVATYEWPAALALTLRSLAEQTMLPGEVLVADDGSGPETERLAAGLAPSYPVPLRYLRQEHRGFRLARLRNLALAHATLPYVIQLDGDLVLHPRFVEDHRRAARPGCFVRGSRVFLPAGLSGALLAGRRSLPRVWERELGKRWAALRAPWLAGALLARPPRADDLRGHHLACWRADAVRVNGYDERFAGWGCEDDEFAARLLAAGLGLRRLRFAALAYHLHHPERPRPALVRRQAMLEDTRRTRRVRCELGLDRHRASPAA